MRKDNLLFINVPSNSSEYEIDDFLANTLLYKLDGEWKYDTSIKLPINNLEILGILNDDVNIETKLDLSKKWIVLKIY